MNYLSADKISKHYADKELFERLDFSVARGQRIALIGLNGTGKTTLLKIIAGLETSDSGTVSVRNDITIGYLDQNPVFDPNSSILDFVISNNTSHAQAIKEYEHALTLDPETEENKKVLADAMSAMDAANAWDHEQSIRQILTFLGIHDVEQNIGLLSGGELKRVALAQLLIQEPDLLIMDEPTNHLDTQMIEWLEGFLNTRSTTLLMVTHDRYFLDTVCNEIAELDNGKLHRYKGNYAYFLEKKEERGIIENTEQEKARGLLRKELEWMRRQPKARTTKSKSRISAFHDLSEKTNIHSDNTSLQLNLRETRQGGKILELKHVYKTYGEKKVIHNLSYTFKKGEKIGIVGKNGSGKSTLLNIITQGIEPDSGKINVGENTVFGYFTQHGLNLKSDMRVIDFIKQQAEAIVHADGSKVPVSQFLTHFRFPYAKQHTYISKLSGGEKKRLHLVSILIRNPNFLILDEPTNDLDLVTLNILEEFLFNFKGCLLIVSHDRYFMDRLADHLFVFGDNGHVTNMNGNYTDYREWQAANAKATNDESSKRASADKQKKQSQDKTKLSYNEQREFDGLEKEIQKLEDRKTELVSLMGQSNIDHEKLNGYAHEIDILIKDVEKKTERWLLLSQYGGN